MINSEYNQPAHGTHFIQQYKGFHFLMDYFWDHSPKGEVDLYFRIYHPASNYKFSKYFISIEEMMEAVDKHAMLKEPVPIISLNDGIKAKVISINFADYNNYFLVEPDEIPTGYFSKMGRYSDWGLDTPENSSKMVLIKILKEQRELLDDRIREINNSLERLTPEVLFEATCGELNIEETIDANK